MPTACVAKNAPTDMKINRKLRIQLFMQNSLFVVLFLALIGLVGYLTREYHYSRDITQGNRNTLTEGSLNVLQQMKGPINITVFVSEDENYRKTIHAFLTRYQRSKSDINFKFVNPAEFPKEAADAGVRNEGEMVVEYAKRTENLSPPYAEQEFTNLLVRLARSQQHAVMFLDGHGERSLTGDKNFDLGEFGYQLGKKGFKLANPDLTIAQEVPRNGAMLVIAGPRVDIPEAEVNKIMSYVARGGNLLWLIDQEPLHGLQPLAEYLGLNLTPGTVIDMSSTQYGADPKVAFASQYGDHAITRNFNLRTLFPEARQVEASQTATDQGWTVTRLIDVAPNGWLETGKIEGKASYDEKSDIAGPINIGLALERKAENITQRVVVIGNGNFLSNTFFGNGGNLDLGVNIVNWLAGDDKLITIQPKPLKDVNVTIPADGWNRFLAMLVFFGARLFLPVALLVTGIVIWWRRRRK
jgi:ABC-type uncharacterized transport system involved in gliding motility auxiliary subunit